MRKRRSILAAGSVALVAIAAGATALQGQQPMIGPTVMTTNPMEVQPDGPPPSWAPRIDPRMLAVIEQLQGLKQAFGTR